MLAVNGSPSTASGSLFESCPRSCGEKGLLRRRPQLTESGAPPHGLEIAITILWNA
jgi:hypothetical protein